MVGLLYVRARTDHRAEYLFIYLPRNPADIGV